MCRAEELIHSRGEAFNALVCLLENQGRAVTRQDSVRTVWEDVSVVSNPINQTVNEIRKALGDDGVNPRFIETVTGIREVFNRLFFQKKEVV